MAPFALSKQTYPNFEVILVDDGCTDESTKLILQEYKCQLKKVKVIRNKISLGLRPARNIGVKNSDGEIIITLDMHTTFDNNFITRVVEIFNTDAKIGAVGSLILDYGDKWFQRGSRSLSMLLFSIRQRISQYNYVFGTAAAYRTAALKDIGFLSESEIVEDTDASWKLVESGWRVITDENNIVYHKGPYQSFKQFLQRVFVGGLRAAYLLSEHRRKFIFPQYIFRLLFFPLLFILLYLNLFPLFFALYIISFTSCLFVVYHQNFRDSLYGTFLSILIIVLSSFGLLYGLLERTVKRKPPTNYD